MLWTRLILVDVGHVHQLQQTHQSDQSHQTLHMFQILRIHQIQQAFQISQIRQIRQVCQIDKGVYAGTHWYTRTLYFLTKWGIGSEFTNKVTR